jgi:NAD(P)-dependent dehydrogenase (short-subunit alcohol dehydrogenase family)
MDLQLAGKSAIVTGGSRGIGKAIARELIAEGAKVAIVGRDQAQLAATAKEIGAFPIQCDTGSDEQVRSMVETALEQLGSVDILVNCAAQPGGQAPPPKLAEINDEVFWPDVNVKVMGYLRCIREVVPHMARHGGGRIVNVSGNATRRTGSTVGSMRNVAVAAMTKNLADELAAQKITLVVVHPGTIRTERTPEVIKQMAGRQGVSEADVQQRMNQANLIGRLVDAAEIAHVVTFLCSPLATAINGDAVTVTGGIGGPIFY